MSHSICMYLSTCHIFIQRIPAKEESSLVEGTLLTMKEAASQTTFTHRICLWMPILLLCALLFLRCVLAKRSWLQINCFAFSHCFTPAHTPCNLLCKVAYTASISFAPLPGTDSRLFNQNIFTAIMITSTNYIPRNDFSVIALKKKKKEKVSKLLSPNHSIQLYCLAK